jgi:hypothetical protein
MIRRLHEGMDLPDFVGRQAFAKSRHLGALATIDHRLKKLLVGKLCGEDIRSASAGALMTNEALASIDIATGGNGVGLAEERIGQAPPLPESPAAKSAGAKLQGRRG